jgi:hypothetical protein
MSRLSLDIPKKSFYPVRKFFKNFSMPVQGKSVVAAYKTMRGIGNKQKPAFGAQFLPVIARIKFQIQTKCVKITPAEIK